MHFCLGETLEAGEGWLRSKNCCNDYSPCFVKFAMSSIKHQRVDRMTIRDEGFDAFKAISLDLSFLPPKQTGFQMNV